MNLLIPYNKNTYDETKIYANSYLLGIKNYTVNMNNLIEESELEEVLTKLKQDNFEIFVNLNKNMFKDDLNNLRVLLRKLNNQNVIVCFYDVSVIEIVKEEQLNIELAWHQEHMTTNYLTINYWKEKGCNYTFLSNEITKEEIEEIKQNTTSKLILQVFGYIPMFVSKRPLITNYKKYFDIKDESKIYNLEYNNRLYPIIENDEYLEAYDAKIRNAYDIEADYIYLNDFLIKNDKFIEVLRCYKEKKYDELEKLYEKQEGFLEEKTVYRVKDL